MRRRFFTCCKYAIFLNFASGACFCSQIIHLFRRFSCCFENYIVNSTCYFIDRRWIPVSCSYKLSINLSCYWEKLNSHHVLWEIDWCKKSVIIIISQTLTASLIKCYRALWFFLWSLNKLYFPPDCRVLIQFSGNLLVALTSLPRLENRCIGDACFLNKYRMSHFSKRNLPYTRPHFYLATEIFHNSNKDTLAFSTC